jgi:hypothetical protein
MRRSGVDYVLSFADSYSVLFFKPSRVGVEYFNCVPGLRPVEGRTCYYTVYSMDVARADMEQFINFLAERRVALEVAATRKMRQRRRPAVVAKLLYLAYASFYGMPLTTSLLGVRYYRRVRVGRSDAVEASWALSTNAFIKSIYRNRGYFESLLKFIGLSWPARR